MTDHRTTPGTATQERHADTPAQKTRQSYLTVFITLLAIWMAYEFLTPLAWAAVLAIADSP
jgi:predicted PurR-regulated permease PerM